MITQQTNKHVDLLIITGDVYDYIEKNTVTYMSSMRALGVAKAAWAARQHGYTAQVIQHQRGLSVQETIDVCTPFIGPETIIGVGTTLISAPLTSGHRNFNTKRNDVWKEGDPPLLRLVSVVDKLRSIHNNKVIVGGSDAVAAVPYFNTEYYITGPAENELPKMLDKIKRNGIQKKPYNWDIKHCGFRWHETDFVQPNEALPYEIARGCIFKCKFCSYDQIGKKPGTFEKTMEAVREDLIYNHDVLKCDHYYMTADTFNDDDERLNKFCDMLETLPFQIKFTGFFRLDLLHRFQNTARRLYENGLSGCNFGIETFHPQASKVIGKPFNGKKAKDFLVYLNKNIFDENVFLSATNIVGLPFETTESLKETAKWYADNPQIATHFFPLRIVDTTTSTSHARLSEFDIAFQKYGYEFPDKEQPWKWKSAWMDYDQALEMTDYMYETIWNSPKRKYNLSTTGWTTMPFFSVMRVGPKEANQRGWNWMGTHGAPRLEAIRANYNKQLKQYALS